MCSSGRLKSRYRIGKRSKQINENIYINKIILGVRVTFAGTLCVRIKFAATLWFRRNCLEACCAVVSWDGADHRIELQEMSSGASPGNNTCMRVVVFVFGLVESRTEHRLVHLLDL